MFLKLSDGLWLNLCVTDVKKKKRIFYIETQQNPKNEKKIIKNKRN